MFASARVLIDHDVHPIIGTRMTNSDECHVLEPSYRVQHLHTSCLFQRLRKLPVTELENWADRHVIELSHCAYQHLVPPF